MKKFFFFAVAALVALVACNKTNYVGDEGASRGNEISFRAMNSVQTKTNDLAAALLPNTWGIYAAATQRTATGLMENPSYFSVTPALADLVPGERLFGCQDATPTATSKWQHGSYTGSPKAFSVSELFWPIGGSKIDFLAYAMPLASHSDADAYWDNTTVAKKSPVPTSKQPWVAQWDNIKTDIASYLSFNSIDTYANQVDVLYAAANGQTSAANGRPSGATTGNSVHMVLNHAQALLIFNVRIDDGAGQLAINEIEFLTPERVKAMVDDQVLVASGAASTLAPLDKDDVTLKTIGTFWVDNSKNVQDQTKANDNYCYNTAAYKMPDWTMMSAANTGIASHFNYGDLLTVGASYAQLGNSLLIPEQEKVNFTMKYTLNGKVLYYTFNDVRGIWQSGYKYIYNLDIDMNEIVLTEEVVPFVDAALPDVAI